jgi:hypothetical protein
MASDRARHGLKWKSSPLGLKNQIKFPEPLGHMLLRIETHRPRRAAIAEIWRVSILIHHDTGKVRPALFDFFLLVDGIEKQMPLG